MLKLIEEADAEIILAEQNLTSAFNELLKHDLIDIEDGKVFLTEKGHLAKELGVEAVINATTKEEMPEKSKGKAVAFDAASGAVAASGVDSVVTGAGNTIQKGDFQRRFQKLSPELFSKIGFWVLPLIILFLLSFYLLS